MIEKQNKPKNKICQTLNIFHNPHNPKTLMKKWIKVGGIPNKYAVGLYQ